MKGIVAMVRKAGTASSIRVHSRSRAPRIISAPTTIRAGAVAIAGTALKSGVRKSDSRNSIPTTTEVRPVRPPSSTPVADST